MSDQDTSQLSDPLSDLDSLSGSGSDSPIQQTAWLATTRERRSTAGNRMKSVLANEEPDSDLELLFAEDENDQGFSDVGEDGSDVQMDSSSDDEDDNNANADDLEGEKELERQAKAKRAAQRKRKAQEAIPAKFRKKVRIDLTTTSSTATTATTSTAPPPRPKKKSERSSWLPSAADLPTRASSRKTTRISKEQLHLQMAEREARRLKQLAQMEKKAAQLEAMKKPPMTQEERLAEAAIVEKRNSKSLNRWEEAEKQREQERKTKLAALNQRTLKGPFITFWSGKGQWDDLELRSLHPYVTEVEEKPKKKKEKADKGGARMRSKNKGSVRAANGQEKDGALGREPEQTEDMNNKDIKEIATRTPDDLQKSTTEIQLSATSETGHTNEDKFAETMKPSNSAQSGDALVLGEKTPPDAKGASSLEKQLEDTRGGDIEDKSKEELKQSSPSTTARVADTHTDAIAENFDERTASRPPPVNFVSTSIGAPNSPSGAPSPLTTRITYVIPFAPPNSAPLSHATSGTTGFAAPSPPPLPAQTTLAASSRLSRTHEPRPSGILAAPILAPPLGMDMNGSATADAPKSNILAAPTISLSEPCQVSQPELNMSTKTTTRMDVTAEAEITDANSQSPPLLDHEPASAGKTMNPMDSEAPAPAPAPTARPESPRDTNATRNGIIFQNFNEIALRDKNIQNLVLFGRKMHKLAKPTAPPICVITNNPARYQDPKTGLPFYNMYAYKELQRLYHGEYKWSRILGAWVGSGSQAAKGVPERFLHPAQAGEKKAAKSGPRVPDPHDREDGKGDSAQVAKEDGLREEQKQLRHVESTSSKMPAIKPAEQTQDAS